MKKLIDGIVKRPEMPGMVGDGFRVYNYIPRAGVSQHRMSPFLMLDFAAAYNFSPTDKPRGVDVHPHKGFETVTIAYKGSVAHHDSAGNSGVIHPGDVQWMTAGSGILHKEYHEENYAAKGGLFQMVQLWVNLPKKDKSVHPHYQALTTEAIHEALTIGREANLPVEISHFKVSGQQNWGRSKETLAMIENARKEGLDVTIDQYPYTASSTSISTLLPDEVLADGQDSIKARLQNKEIKNQVILSMLKRLKKRKLKHFSYAVVANFAPDTSFNGKSIEAINLMMGRKHKARQEAETIIDIMLKGGAGAVFHGMGDQDVKHIMKYPFNMFASDASIRIFNQGVPHPRGYGTNARVLGKYVRDEKTISLEEAIRRMSSLPAQKFHLKDRGLLKEGMAADIVLFDEAAVKDMATYQKPHAYSKGFHYVLVNGHITLENEKHTGVRAGIALYGNR